MQNYAFVYCLENITGIINSNSFLQEIEVYKLRDGLTYVNAYHLFARYIPTEDKPIIRAITYASPGFIELILNYEVAKKIAESVNIFLALFNESYSAYKNLKEIYSNLSKRRKEKHDSSLKLAANEIREVRKLNEELAKSLGYANLTDLSQKVGDPEEVSKLLLAHYRRMKAMSQFVQENKADFPLE
ncbi:hypothetical protein NI467_07595 [Acinetobacter bohemicus]|nr:hypothetical protein [Acinetobacter sp. S4397-1]MCO8045209.1 hypothetical protein [Acinetobacter sp. S4397-1]